MKPSEILIEARKLIDTPDKWTKGSYATDGQGKQVPSYSGQAQCFCTLGAFFHASASFSEKPFVQTSEHEMMERQARRALGNAINPNEQTVLFADWNDAPERTHVEVLAAYDGAIAALVEVGQ